jgi:hypothetical protein
MLGDKAWCISYKDSACRCFGFLVSKKRYVFTIDDDCFVAKNPKGEVGCAAPGVAGARFSKAIDRRAAGGGWAAADAAPRQGFAVRTVPFLFF